MSIATVSVEVCLASYQGMTAVDRKFQLLGFTRC